MNRDALGYFTMVLHAHLPFVRDPDHERFLEESWLHEALTGTYLPLLMGFEASIRDGVDFRLTMNLTPTLVSMLDDELLRDRYEKNLRGLVELSEREMDRQRHAPEFHDLAGFYRERFSRILDFYLHRCGRDVAGAFGRLQELGHVEIITSAATHGYLPLLRHQPSSVRAQIRIAVDHHTRRFGRRPRGFWLPECGFYPGLDEVLAEAGICYFFVESHGLLHGDSRPQHGVYAPTVCPSGVAAFARDPECAKQVWSVEEGFPGAPDYREFYRDIGHDLPLDHVGPYIGPDGLRIDTGLKYYRITGSGEEKKPYVRERALQQAARHAAQFLDWRLQQMDWLARHVDRRPIIVAPYDAELFGHWWFEGPDWINFLLRKIAFDQDRILTATPSEYLAEYPEAQVAMPSASSWGEGGYNEVWLNERNDWVIPEVLAAAGEMARLARRHRGAGGARRRILNQAARKLLIAQASDWPFILRNDTATEFATARVRECLASFRELRDLLGNCDVDALDSAGLERLEDLERKDNLFPDLDFEVFAETFPRPSYAILDTIRHVAFLSAEAAPYVKVGGLADVVGALPPALARWGMKITVLLPAYRSIDRQKHGVRLLMNGLSIPMGGESVPFRLLEADAPADNVRLLLVEQERYFDREGVYVDPATGEEYPDTGERFAFFTRAGLEALRALGEPVDVVHSHDHHTALASAYVKMLYKDDPILGSAASVYTLHNLGYQGVYPEEILDKATFGRDQFFPGSPFEHYGAVNFMKVGIHFADKVNTVSETYARETATDERLGAGLADVLRARGADFRGILNGIDTSEWNPETDAHIPEPYNAESPGGKRAAKKRLYEVAGLDPSRLDDPLIGIITRLVDQKGLDLLYATLGRILDEGVSLVVLGTGLRKYEDFFRQAASDYAGRVAALIKFDNGLAHLIEAGSDLFLMPSLYEPCGLNQMYSLRYGTVPVVRATGGLADTVTDDDALGGNGVGFSFSRYEPEALVDAVVRAVRAYRDPERWKALVFRGMKRDFSWAASALKYNELYRSALARRS